MRISDDSTEPTYPLRTVARLTGLSPELLRAWERRYQAVEPRRTPGGTRRYRAADLERLRLLKAAVDAGHRIGRIAALPDAELARLEDHDPPLADPPSFAAVLAALERLDGAETQRLLTMQFQALGPVRFARQLAVPLAREIGRRWEHDRLGIASEHLGTGVLRSLLGSALQPTRASLQGPRIVFATPGGERHELGLQTAALTAMGAGANPLYLGTDLPTDEIAAAALGTGARAVALSVVTPAANEAERALAAIREALGPHVYLWVGGTAAERCALPAGVERFSDLGAFEQRVALLALESGRGLAGAAAR